MGKNQPVVCMNVLCSLFKQEQWNPNYVAKKETAPWDNHNCPSCGRKTEPFWIIEYHYKLPGMKELEGEILSLDAQIKELKEHHQ